MVVENTESRSIDVAALYEKPAGRPVADGAALDMLEEEAEVAEALVVPAALEAAALDAGALETAVDEDDVPVAVENFQKVKRLGPPHISVWFPLQAILHPVLPSGAGPPAFRIWLSQ